MVSAATPFCGKVSRRTVSRATFSGEAFNGYFLAWAAFCAMHKSNSCGAFLLNHQAWRAPDSLLICAQVLWITLALLTLAKFVTNFAFVVREWRDAVRVYFFNMMNVSLFMYAIAVPAALEDDWRAARTAAFCIASVMQIGFNLEVYRRWLFCKGASLASAGPQYMLSTVGWALGCLLAQDLDLDRRWRIGVAELMIGCAVVFCVEINQ